MARRAPASDRRRRARLSQPRLASVDWTQPTPWRRARPGYSHVGADDLSHPLARHALDRPLVTIYRQQILHRFHSSSSSAELSAPIQMTFEADRFRQTASRPSAQQARCRNDVRLHARFDRAGTEALGDGSRSLTRRVPAAPDCFAPLAKTTLRSAQAGTSEGIAISPEARNP
jgi:hypothetical protein